MLTSYDVTALAIIQPNKHQSLADPLLQSSVVTRGVVGWERVPTPFGT